MARAERCVLLADHHQSIVEGLRGLLSSRFSAIVMVADRSSLTSAAGALHPQLVVLDLSLARGAGLSLIPTLLSLCPSAKLIVLGPAGEPGLARRLLEAGVHGFVVKTSVASDLLDAVEAVLSGGVYGWPQAAVVEGGH